MKFNEIVSITGVSGLKRVVGKRTDGLIVSDLDGNNKKFVPSRQHLFSPLDNISIYTYQDSVPLLDVFIKMKDTTPPDANSDQSTLRTYMESLIADHDQHRVHLNDIKKLIKWYNILAPYNLFVKEEASEEASAE